MADHWWQRPGRRPGRELYHWHILFHDQPKVRELAAMAGIEPPLDRIELDDRQLGEGYGRPTSASEAAAQLLARTEGILVDPIYTAKALAGLINLVRSGAVDGRRAVFWDGGGLPSLFETSVA